MLEAGENNSKHRVEEIIQNNIETLFRTAAVQDVKEILSYILETFDGDFK